MPYKLNMIEPKQQISKDKKIFKYHAEIYMWIVVLSFPAYAVYNAGAGLYRIMEKLLRQ